MRHVISSARETKPSEFCLSGVTKAKRHGGNQSVEMVPMAMDDGYAAHMDLLRI